MLRCSDKQNINWTCHQEGIWPEVYCVSFESTCICDFYANAGRCGAIVARSDNCHRWICRPDTCPECPTAPSSTIIALSSTIVILTIAALTVVAAILHRRRQVSFSQTVYCKYELILRILAGSTQGLMSQSLSLPETRIELPTKITTRSMTKTFMSPED